MSDLTDRLLWAKEHDEEMLKISQAATKLMYDVLEPENILCYVALLLTKFSTLLGYKPTLRESEGMQRVRWTKGRCLHEKEQCVCKKYKKP
jgi:hypothetical protein